MTRIRDQHGEASLPATARVVAGNLGCARQMEYTVIGDTVNLAARLTSKAPRGEVWANETTAGRLRPFESADERCSLAPRSERGADRFLGATHPHIGRWRPSRSPIST
jgi:class 3 adenylate cyclase